MYRVRILSVGKTKENWLDEGIHEYVKRLKNEVELEFVWAKSTEHLILLASKEPRFICLDSAGTLMTSEGFSSFILKQLEIEGARLSLIIGGAEGLPESLKHASTKNISLSPLTFTHQMARLMLVEQIYRALEIYKKTPYHK